jgi:aarF domain-containing kinase
MPHWQMEVINFSLACIRLIVWQKVMKTALGPNYMSNFHTFNPIPFAAASIGQVHEAQLKADVSLTGQVADVVVKVM